MADTASVTQSFLIAGTLQNATVSVTQSFLIVAAGVGITCGSPPNGTIGVAYTHTFPSGGGEAPLTFAVTAGTLPGGLTLNASTGVLSGTPTSPGVFPFTITVTDALRATASVACSITIPNNTVITLLGWKLYPDEPCEDTVEGLEVPKVDRAV